MTDYGLERSAEILAHAFSDYFVRIPFNVPMLLNMVRADSIDLASSRVFVRNGVALGAALIARRGWTSRLAAMAIVPETRRTGLGRAAVVRLVEEAKARGERAMVLEVIEQNTAAVELYRASGFTVIRRLIGFAGPGPAIAGSGDESRLTEVDLREVADAVFRYGLRDLPWQLSAPTLAQLTPPAVGYHLDGAWIAITDPAAAVVSVRALIAEPIIGDGTPPCRSREASLLLAVIAKYPRRDEWRLNPVWPEELAPFLEPAGLSRMEVSQWQMQCTL